MSKATYRTFRAYKLNLLRAICYFSNFLVNYDDCATVGTFRSGKLDDTLGKAEDVNFDIFCERTGKELSGVDENLSGR